jgi:hypothetical protein
MSGQITTDIFIQNLPANSLTALVRNKEGQGLKAYVQGLDLNAAAPIDLTTVTVPSSLYVPVACYVYGPTANLSSATLGLYTAAGAGGTAIVAPTLLANLTGTRKFQSLAIAALTDVIIATTLYPRLTVASGVAGTASLVLQFLDLSLI